MNDQVASAPLSRRQRWILTALIASIVIVSAVDVIGDLTEGAGAGHVAAETAVILLGVVGIGWIWAQKQRLETRGAALTERLSAASAEAEAWRLKAQEHLQGLGKAIDDQFQAWSLTAAEKEVALLLLKGLSLKEISDVRGTSERTTRQQAQEAYRKSGLTGRAEFAAFFLEELLLPRDKPEQTQP